MQPPMMPRADRHPDAARECAPPSPSNLGNDLTSLNATLDRLNDVLGMALDRIRGPRPEVGHCEEKCGDATIQFRLSHAGHAAEKAEYMAKELMNLLGE